MAQTVFFSFKYEHLARIHQIVPLPNVTHVAAAGFDDDSLWESAKNDASKIKEMADKALEGSSVTVVCITHGISTRLWINHEIDQSLKLGNGLLGLHIHHLHDSPHPDPREGDAPWQIKAHGFKIRQYSNQQELVQWIAEAKELAG